MRFGSKVYRQIVGFAMGTKCDPMLQIVFVLL